MVATIMTSDQVSTTICDLVLIDDVCSFLTPRLVAELKHRGIEVIGIFEPSEGPDAKRRLLECGISDVIDADAKPVDFLEKVEATLSHHVSHLTPTSEPFGKAGLTVGVCGAAQGVGATEVSVGLAHLLSVTHTACLIDLDPFWPSVAQRLDLPLHPNLRTTLDRIHHDPAGIFTTFHDYQGLAVIPGVADHGMATPLELSDASPLLESTGEACDVVVADLGPADRAIRGCWSLFDSVVIVGLSDPVGVTRMAKSIDQLSNVHDLRSVLLVVNRATGGRFQAAEVRNELAKTSAELPTFFLPEDRHLSKYAWAGTVTGRGAFARGLADMAGLIEAVIE